MGVRLREVRLYSQYSGKNSNDSKLTYIANSQKFVNVPDKDEVLRGCAEQKWFAFLSKAGCAYYSAMA